MYEVIRVTKEALHDLQKKIVLQTVFTTFPWVEFLEKDQGIESVVLEFSKNGKPVAYFVGGIISKFGVRILGSPFEGWLTCDMGFIIVAEFNYEEGFKQLKRYAFRNLKCHYVRVIGKNIPRDIRARGIVEHTKLLRLDISKSLDQIMSSFTKNGRRDIRASQRKGLSFEQVDFDRDFANEYYTQLVDVFAKQGLEPFYSIEKIYNLVDAFKDNPELVLALVAKYDGKTVASVLSFAYGDWAYYVGAASYREYQKYLPNEGLFWKFIEHWHDKGIKYIDLVGYREYKMKYNPEVIDEQAIIFQKYPGLHLMKNLAYHMIMLKRRIRGINKR